MKRIFQLMLKIRSTFIGYIDRKTNKLRIKKLKLKGYKVGKDVYIGKKCGFGGPGIEIGDNVTIVYNCQFQGPVKIGKNCIIASNVQVLSTSHDFYAGNALPYGTDYIVKTVIIEDNVWIGNNVLIAPGATIGEGAVIAFGSLVTKNIPKGALAGGNPARVLKTRDLKQYERLKRENRYLNDLRGRYKVTKKDIGHIESSLKNKIELYESELSDIQPRKRAAALYYFSTIHSKYKFILDEQEYKIVKVD